MELIKAGFIGVEDCAVNPSVAEKANYTCSVWDSCF